MSHPLIFNPRSRSGKGERVAREAADKLAARGIPVELIPTEGPGGARPLARKIVESGVDRLFVVGGDGTLSEAADGVLLSGESPELAFLPGGTGNSFLMDFGLGTLDAAVARIAEGKARPIDAAVAEWEGGRRHFINVFGVGFAAKVCDYANRRLKWMGGSAYAWAVFRELMRLASPRTRLTLDGKAVEDEFALVAVCNTQHTGGAMQIAPMARPDDGQLEVIALRGIGRVELLHIFPKIFTGAHVGHPKVFHAQAKEIEVVPGEPSPLLGDGEVYGETPVRIEVKPGALRVLV